TLDTGKGYEVPQAPKPSEIVQGTEAGLPPLRGVDFSMAWDFPGETTDGDYGGAVLLGFPRAPGVLVIPVSVGLDRIAPSIPGVSLRTSTGERLNDTDNRTTTDPSPTLLWSPEDPSRGELDPTRVVLTLDGEGVTTDATITMNPRANAQGVQGRWDGTIQYSPSSLSEGVHGFILTVGDLAGNLATQSVTVVLDTTAPPLAIEGAHVRYTRASTAAISAVTSPGAFLSFGGAWVQADGTGRYTTTIPLVAGENEVHVSSADWFDHDLDTGEPIAGNANTATLIVVRDDRAPAFSRTPSPDDSITRGDGATIRGTLVDEIAPGVAEAPSGIALSVAGVRTAVRADGSFTAVVPLTEGDNTIEVYAVDPAGNEARAWANVTRDTIAPSLAVDPIATRVTEGRIVVSGTADPGSIVTVNGVVVPLQGARFTRNVSLSGGDNVLVVRAEDTAGNSREMRFSVAFVSPAGSPTTGIGLAVAGILAAAVIMFLLGRRFLFGGSSADLTEISEGGGAEATAPSVVPPEQIAETAEPSEIEARTEAAAVEPVPLQAEPEVEDVDAALQDFEAFENENLESAPPGDPRVTKLREAYESGKISREVYEANLKRIGKPS
ncbi:MAG TPA: hypothetical protein VK723_02795, partial [Thermoplasmata archaeon]|nr:hypothetical protein [Thermoplasmata archaeon]